jgi:uncharacterized protein
MSIKNRIRMEIKEVSEEGVFEGLLSPYGNLDAGRDIVEPGAYTKTLKDHGNTVPLLWQHQSSTPIGKLELIDREDGLWAKGTLELGVEKAREAHTLLKAKIIKGLSIGYESIKDEIKDGIRILKEVRLWEGSVVTFPMNELAEVTSIKSALDVMDSDDYEKKVGAALSAASKAKLRAACEKIKSGHDDIEALYEDEAGDSTSDDKAAKNEKSEPAGDHSAKELGPLIQSIRAILR